MTGSLWYSLQSGDGFFTASPPERNEPEKSRVSQTPLHDERTICHLYLHLPLMLVRSIEFCGICVKRKRREGF